MAITLGELAKLLDADLQGDAQVVIENLAPLNRALKGDLAFLANTRYRKHLHTTAASAVIISHADRETWRGNALVVADPYVAYAKVANLLCPKRQSPSGIHPTAIVDPTSQIHQTAFVGAYCVIGANTTIAANAELGPHCIIGDNVTIGEAVRLVARVTILEKSQVGKRALIHPGVVIGSDGFGLANDQGVWLKIPQLGRVVIGDDVEIGANTTIDRGALENTVLEDGVKLDNQIQVGHNVVIGKHTAIAGCVGIAGSTKIGSHCAIGGGVGVLGHLEIADHVQITAMSLVTKSIQAPGIYSSGTPLEPNQRWHKNFVRYKQLDEMAHRLRAVEEIINKERS